MFRYRSTFCLVILALVVVVLVGCGNSDYRKQEVYYLIATNVDLPYWQAARAGLVQAATELGVHVELIGPAEYDAQAEKEEFLRVTSGEELPAGVLLSVADPAVMTEPINSAVAKGINVVTIDADAPESKRLAFIGTDNYSVGVQAAELTADLLQNAGNVIVFTIEGQSNLADRLRGVKDIFAQFPAIRVIDVVDIKGTDTVAFDTTKDIMDKDRSRVDAFLCLEAIAAPEVAEVLSRNNEKGKFVIAMDTPSRTLDWIQRGMIETTIAQKPYTMAYTGLRMLADLHKYPPTTLKSSGSLATVPTFVDTGATLINKENVQTFIDEQKALNPGGTAAPAAE